MSSTGNRPAHDERVGLELVRRKERARERPEPAPAPSASPPRSRWSPFPRTRPRSWPLRDARRRHLDGMERVLLVETGGALDVDDGNVGRRSSGESPVDDAKIRHSRLRPRSRATPVETPRQGARFPSVVAPSTTAVEKRSTSGTVESTGGDEHATAIRSIMTGSRDMGRLLRLGVRERDRHGLAFDIDFSGRCPRGSTRARCRAFLSSDRLGETPRSSSPTPSPGSRAGSAGCTRDRAPSGASGCGSEARGTSLLRAGPGSAPSTAPPPRRRRPPRRSLPWPGPRPRCPRARARGLSLDVDLRFPRCEERRAKPTSVRGLHRFLDRGHLFPNPRAEAAEVRLHLVLDVLLRPVNEADLVHVELFRDETRVPATPARRAPHGRALPPPSRAAVAP